MEGVWTRFLPVSEYVRNVVVSGRLGRLQRVYADYSHALDPEKTMHDGKHRMVNPDLAGGALLGSVFTHSLGYFKHSSQQNLRAKGRCHWFNHSQNNTGRLWALTNSQPSYSVFPAEKRKFMQSRRQA